MATPIISSSSKKFAVIIGINYTGTSSQLSGCINDANSVKTLLIEKFGYLESNMLYLTDDTTTKPTKQNIINSFNTLIKKATDENFTELWFSYSGHGSYATDLNGDENDRRDELICPLDFGSAGMIADDFIYDNLIVKLPATATLFSIMDSCNSGTVFDLPHIYITSPARNNNNNRHVATVVTVSGCRDDQTSADAYINSKYQGAMTWSFINALTNAKFNIKIMDLINNMRILLKTNYTQVPLLAVSSEAQFDRVLISGPISSIVTPPTTKLINFTIKVDYWYNESSWNILSLADNKYIYDTDNKFTAKYQEVKVTKELALGNYKLHVKDTYGDGGITLFVMNGLVVLVSAKMITGKFAEYYFAVV